jgi:hypothetical protein
VEQRENLRIGSEFLNFCLFYNMYQLLVELLLSLVHHLTPFQHSLDINQGVIMRSKNREIIRGCSENKMDLLAKNGILCNKIRVLYNTA